MIIVKVIQSWLSLIEGRKNAFVVEIGSFFLFISIVFFFLFNKFVFLKSFFF